MEKQNSLLRIWELGKDEHPGLIKSIFSAVLGVLLGFIPYIACAQIIIAMLNGETEFSFYLNRSLIALAGYAGKSVFYTLALATSHKATFSILKSIRLRILEKLPKLPLGTIMDTSSGKIKQIVVDNVESTETTLAHILPEFTSNFLGPLCIIVYLFVLDWRMALLSVISIPIGFSFMGLTMKDYATDFAGSVKVNEEVNKAMVEYIGGIEVIKAFNQGKSSYQKFTDKIIANAAYFYNWMKKCQIPMSLSMSITPATLITVLPIGWLFYVNGSLSVEVFVMTIILSMGIVGPLMKAASFGDSLAKISTIVASIDEILNGKEQEHGNTKANIKSYDIELNNVSFGYHEDKEILHNISLSIPAESLTALVGPSGSGKSTIAKLIAGFWDVNSGFINLGGIDENKIPLEQLYSQIAFVTQENYLFDDTIMENLRMGKISSSDEDVINAAKAAGCHDFIMSLDNGYETKVGSGGAHLSGGERQRISIARAILKDSPIIILDEATAYIDPENEAIIQRAVAKLVQNKTVIIIAHRLSTITDADKIVVVNDGNIEDEGTHEELLKSSALYSDMWNAHMSVKEDETIC